LLLPGGRRLVTRDDLLDSQPAVGIDADIDSKPIAGAIVEPDYRQIRRPSRGCYSLARSSPR